ncbi:MAG: hemolysin [Flavobacteriaceae bacterium]|nr:hemolysin [Flavobacteriaceae bacterium]
MEHYWIIIGFALLLSAFFSGMEIAFVSANKIHVEIEKKQEGFLSQILGRLTGNPSKFIASMLIGNNIALVVYGYYMGDVLTKMLPSATAADPYWMQLLLNDFVVLTQTVISTAVILITAEFLPKVLFQIYANSLIKVLALPAYFFYILFSGLSWLVIKVSDFVLRIFFKTAGDEITQAFSKDELGDYINEQMEAVRDNDEIDSEVQIFQNALEFSEVKTREAMIPRTEICAVEYRDRLSDLSKLFTETGFSKILVYRENIDDIIGYVHSFDLFKKPQSIRSIMKTVEYVPETMLIQDTLNLLTKKRRSMAVVIDEYGGTSGILTVEDIIEELFGEIEDEHDVVEYHEEQIDDCTYLFSARLEVDYLNEQYKLNLPESEEYETLGGLIMNQTEDIPEKGFKMDIDSYVLDIVEVSSTKVVLVKIHCNIAD